MFITLNDQLRLFQLTAYNNFSVGRYIQELEDVARKYHVMAALPNIHCVSEKR